jgi:hypothetical protein
MRKCDVLLYAAGHSDGEEREEFLKAAARFFDYSVTTLNEMPTRTLARPLVLMLSNGYLYLSPDAAAPRPTPPVVDDFGAPTVFVPQKTLAKRRIGMTATAVGVLLVSLLALL